MSFMNKKEKYETSKVLFDLFLLHFSEAISINYSSTDFLRPTERTKQSSTKAIMSFLPPNARIFYHGIVSPVLAVKVPDFSREAPSNTLTKFLILSSSVTGALSIPTITAAPFPISV